MYTILCPIYSTTLYVCAYVHLQYCTYVYNYQIYAQYVCYNNIVYKVHSTIKRGLQYTDRRSHQ